MNENMEELKGLEIKDFDEELKMVEGAIKTHGKKPQSLVEDTYEERRLLVKAAILIALLVIVVFLGIFAYQLLAERPIDKSLDVFKVFLSAASPIATLVLGFYFGSKSSRK
ncbi:hypothetical protein [Paenibacillus gansuensis]|uniref:Uncharacterized protein n=1 Tax=Paenibacillus gansuensis TaxID=306542 RepID=A0ABW5PIM5_9BACL